ncbi:hypothetical protein [Brevibacterium zhoupengii]|uniref:hypothetical protein n=1 Tax=Brevibacterium zhoupengii TaxID=2898795 RepID=UPI001F09602B|nr:hypothetical protein [Brevibacterium zhoupengii]
MSTIDEILATGRYVDRRGREWVRRLFLRPNIRWANIIRDSDGIGWPGEKISEDRMRLLIERDQHRDVCPGLGWCLTHPVVSVDRNRLSKSWQVWGPGDWHRTSRGTFPEAMDAARASAVGE